MKRSLMAVAAALIGSGVLATTASAQEVQIGVTSTPLVAPTCPAGVSAADCTIVLNQMTALETIRDGVSYPTLISKPGLLESFTVGISALSTDAADQKKYVANLDSSYGGPPEAQLTVLRQIGKHKNFRWQVVASSSAISLANYLGQVVQFPLTQGLPVVPGEVVAFTTPTWAPVLSIDLTANKFAYRQSRNTDCNNKTTPPITPQLEIGQQSVYGCNYTGTRIEYSATEVLTP